jgi:glycosyltransferase involved in cell wall biosynthesis
VSERIRLLLTIPDLSGGGAEREMVNLARGLSRERFEVHLLLHRPGFAHRVPEDVTLAVLARTRPWHTPRTVRAIRRIVDRTRPDVVFSQLHYANLLTGSALARTRHRPRWLARHTGDPRRELRGPFAHWARRVLARADRVVGCSDGVSDALREHLRIPGRRVVTLANVVDARDVVARSRQAPAIARRPGVHPNLHPARVLRANNQALLRDAVARPGAPPPDLWMLGDGPLRETLERRARALGVAERVRWLGFVANPFPLFRAADVLALSSDAEGLPNVIVEAALCGTPSVATRCRFGPEEAIEDGVDGRLTPVGDVSAFASALAGLAADPGKSRALGERARHRAAANFEFGKRIADYEQLIDRVLAAPAGR